MVRQRHYRCTLEPNDVREIKEVMRARGKWIRGLPKLEVKEILYAFPRRPQDQPEV